MSSVTIQGNPSGTGIFTVASPNSNTNQTLVLPNASGTLLTNSGTEAGAFSTLSVAGNNISAVNSLGFRNRIINGDMRIDQRNNGAAATLPAGAGSVSTFPVDRWQVFKGNAGALTIQRVAVAPAGFSNSVLITVTTTMSGASDFAAIRQNIEGFNVADLGWGTANAQSVTAGFWIRCSITGTFNCSFLNSAENRAYVASFTISAANTWEYKTVTIPGDTSGTWVTDNGTGLRFLIDLGTGSTFSTTAGSWQAFNFGYGLTGGTKLMANAGATMNITGVQLEAGSVATPFERRDYGRELIMCQRYFQRDLVGAVGAWSTGSAAWVLTPVPFPVLMRTAPTITQPSSFTIQGITASAVGFNFFASTPVAYSIGSSSANGQADGVCRRVDPNSVVFASAEL